MEKQEAQQYFEALVDYIKSEKDLTMYRYLHIFLFLSKLPGYPQFCFSHGLICFLEQVSAYAKHISLEKRHPMHFRHAEREQLSVHGVHFVPHLYHIHIMAFPFVIREVAYDV